MPCIKMYSAEADYLTEPLFHFSAEALFKAGISALLEAPTTITVDGKPKSSETFLIQYIHSFLSNLIIVPV